MTAPVPWETGKAPAENVPWARQAGPAAKRQTERERRLVDDLPAWDPLPPGEITVSRHRKG